MIARRRQRLSSIVVFLGVVLSCLCAQGSLWAQVTLEASTSPGAAQPGVTIVNVVGSGFPIDAILPANVTINLDPATVGGGPSGTTTATDVTLIFDTVVQVTFQIPSSIMVSTPTAYLVSISGTTATAIAFSSLNTASLTVNPAASVSLLSPNTGQAGQSSAVTIAGQFTNFVQGATMVSFGAGISVGGGIEGDFGPATVTSPTSATAQIVINAAATAGGRTVTVQTGVQQASRANAFTVQGASTPTLVSVNPNAGPQGQTVSVALIGQSTNFVQGTTQASFGAGIVVGTGSSGGFGPVTVNSPTSATAQLTIDAAAALGSRTVSVQTGAEQVSLTSGFTVTGSGGPDPIVTITSPVATALFNKSPITVTGTVDNALDKVVVNGIAASLSGTTFTASSVPLREGNNQLTATATDPAGKVGTATVSVTLDTTPPTVTIDAPSNGAVLNSSSVTVAGMVNDIVSGTVNAAQVKVIVNGVQASVSNRSYEVANVPLVQGRNTIKAVATDRAGNQSETQVQVTFQAGIPQQKIVIVSGNSQRGVIGATLANPLIVQVQDANGNPVANRQVTFTVRRSDGKVRSLPQEGQQITVGTDSKGQASVLFQLGTRVGVGINQVSATAPGYVGEVIFCETATAGVPTQINVAAGDGQQGVTGRPLPAPLEAIVFDGGGNVVAGVPVTFNVNKGGGTLAGASTVTVKTNDDGKANVVMTLGLQEGINNNVVTASFDGSTGAPAIFSSSGRVPGPAAATKVSGVVLDNANVPIPRATAKIEGTNLSAVTDAQGRFSISGVPVGTVTLLVDGRTSTRPETFPFLAFMLTTIAGTDNTVGGPLLLPPLDTTNAQIVGGDKDVVLKMAGVQGYEFTVFARSVRNVDGTPYVGPMTLSQVHSDKVPMAPPNGTAPNIAGTLQPAGLHFTPPIKVQFPNTSGLAPGTVIDVYSFDHDIENWASQGPARVSADGSVIVSDSGFGITKSGWHFAPPPPPPRTCASGCDNGDPCSKHECKDGACVDTPIPAQDAKDCQLSNGRTLSSAGITVSIDKSCSKGTCNAGSCKPKSDRWGLDTISAAATDAMNKILQATDDKGCMGDPVRTTMQTNLKSKGLNITCVDSSSSAGGGDDCGSSFIGDKTFTLSNLSAGRCGSLAKTIRHESQHGAGNTDHVNKADGTLDCSKDHVYACDQACYGANNCGTIDAATAKANCK